MYKKVLLAGLMIMLILVTGGCSQGSPSPENTEQESSSEEASGEKKENTNGESGNKDQGNNTENSDQPNIDENKPSTNKGSSDEKSNNQNSKDPQQAEQNPQDNSNNQLSSVDYNFFNDTVFVGDSVTLKLKYYVTEKRSSDPKFMGTAQFLCAGSLGSANALWEVSDKSVHPLYKGQKLLIEDSVSKIGAKKLYIMLGINDIGMYGVDQSAQNMEKLIDKIVAKSPEINVCVQSATPMLKGKELQKLNNTSLREYNNKLLEMCKRKGYKFIDVASVMKDSEGYLPLKYCSDPSGPSSLGLHFTPEACEVWIKYLLIHT